MHPGYGSIEFKLSLDRFQQPRFHLLARMSGQRALPAVQIDPRVATALLESAALFGKPTFELALFHSRSSSVGDAWNISKIAYEINKNVWGVGQSSALKPTPASVWGVPGLRL